MTRRPAFSGDTRSSACSTSGRIVSYGQITGSDGGFGSQGSIELAMVQSA